MGMLRALQEFRHLLAFAQLHVGLLPVRPAAGVAPLALFLAVRNPGPDACHLGAEQRLDRPANLDLVRVERHLEDKRPSILALNGRLLGDERPADDVGELHASTSCSFSIAPRVATTRSALATSRAVTCELGTNATPLM